MCFNHFMTVITEILIYLYAALMILATLSAHFKMPAWLFGANLISAISILCFPLNLIFLKVGLIAIIIVAILNGLLINGKIRVHHIIVRICISLLLYLLAI